MTYLCFLNMLYNFYSKHVHLSEKKIVGTKHSTPAEKEMLFKSFLVNFY